MTVGGRSFREVWAVDFEYHAPPGERPRPLCVVARELAGGRVVRVWLDGCTPAAPPYPTDGGSLLVAYYASAELGCHLAMGWPMPMNVLDLYAEFRNHTNGLPTPSGAGLLGALVYHRLDAMSASEKGGMRELAMRGGPYTDEEQAELLVYCESDVNALAALLPRMAESLDLERALLRGRYMAAAARMEHAGVPIDVGSLEVLRARWTSVQSELIGRIDSSYHVYDGRTFKANRWAAWLASKGIPWPRLPTGSLALDDDTFRDMAKSFPEVAPIRELRWTLGQMRLAELAVGSDGRNRCLLSAYASKTGRNQPSNTKFIFGPSTWLRALIRPAPGMGLAYLDWSQQEFGIAAALSRDANMQAAYHSSDPYLAFAKMAGAAPADATKATHPKIREQFKACVLAVQYGMGADSLAVRIGQPAAVARELLHKHRRTFATFWRWSDAAVDIAMLRGRLHTVFGWTVHVGPDANGRSLRNFPMQANGAELLRLACILATERGIRVCAPVHDAILIEAPAGELVDAVDTGRELMARASSDILSGFRLRTDAKIILHPERFMDERGVKMWETVQAVLAELPPLETCSATAHVDVAPVHMFCCTSAHPSNLILSSIPLYQG